MASSDQPHAARHEQAAEPACASWRELAGLALVWLVALGLCLWFDRQIFTWFDQHATPEGSLLRRGLRWCAKLTVNPLTYVLIAIAVLRATRASDQRRRLILGFVTCVGLCTLLTHTLKTVIGRARPREALSEGPYDIRPFESTSLEFDSFPSGHASEATMLAILAVWYLPWLRWPATLLACVACLARVAGEAHWASDVLAGAGLAGGVALMVRWRLGSRYFRVPTAPDASTPDGAARPARA